MLHPPIVRLVFIRGLAHRPAAANPCARHEQKRCRMRDNRLRFTDSRDWRGQSSGLDKERVLVLSRENFVSQEMIRNS